MIHNARITGTNLGTGWTDHGIMSFNIMCEFDSGRQGFGQYTLDTPVKDGDGKFLYRRGTAFGCECIRRVCEVLECDWEGLKGQYVRIEKDGFNDPIEKIGHIVKDKWFSVQEVIEEMGVK
jgi:hypothetical protein